ncbi:MAG: ABC transporter ATP-binding protein [Candidatus Schekmanbacteria bacterium RBG_13_48_7]|uniref:ABC transporter ATP-binding protein n=1 Tax=Candidatus Schekmanbacteria bacterium RBG_13_48_7 TaxID=1817878 RepID=A0A1F7RN69_9BACT|nr:MAG: ABC transporter ATP-binding protein [Candidatus Schekmanbacteria bacterium RBG_13_48_7]
MNEIVVQTKNLTKRFGRFTAVDNISMTVYRGEIFGFLGANGAGKTTAIRMLCGLLRPTSGEGQVAGFDIVHETEKIKSRIGYMSQKFSLYEDLRLEENLEFFGGMYGLAGSRLNSRMDQMIRQFQLDSLKNRLTVSLPLGWKQKLALACSLLHDPEILFLDEATGGVDPITRRNFWDIIGELANNGKTIFVTTHYMDEAEYCHRIVIMAAGKIVVTGSPIKLKQQFNKKSIEELFIDLVKQNNPSSDDK